MLDVALGALLAAGAGQMVVLIPGNLGLWTVVAASGVVLILAPTLAFAGLAVALRLIFVLSQRLAAIEIVGISLLLALAAALI